MAKKVTLHDIAIAANVADSTASKALTGTGRISAETRRRVRDIAAQFGYLKASRQDSNRKRPNRIDRHRDTGPQRSFCAAAARRRRTRARRAQPCRIADDLTGCSCARTQPYQPIERPRSGRPHHRRQHAMHGTRLIHAFRMVCLPSTPTILRMTQPIAVSSATTRVPEGRRQNTCSASGDGASRS